MTAQILQLTFSLIAVMLMTGLCAALFGRKDTRLADQDAAAQALAREIAGFRAGASALGTDGKAALIEDAATGDLYLAVARGDGIVMRKLKASLLARVVRDGTHLELALADFTLRRATLALTDADAAMRWDARLRGLR
jgi:hypothetical protein